MYKRLRTLKGSGSDAVRDALAEQLQQWHTYGAMPGFSEVAMAFSGARPVASGVTDDLGRMIDPTACKVFRISTCVEYLALRALLSQLLVELHALEPTVTAPAQRVVSARAPRWPRAWCS